MKCIYATAFFLVIFRAAFCQVWEPVMHKDLYKQQLINTAAQKAQNSLYESTMDDIKDLRNKDMTYMGSIDEIQQTIYKNLTNIDDAIANGKMAQNNASTVIKIYNNLTELTKLAAGKPYLVSILSQTTPVLIGRMTHMTTYVKEFVKSHNPQILMNQTQRDKMLYGIFTDLQIIYNLTAAMVADFQLYNLQAEINKAVPFKDYFNKDNQIVEQIIGHYQF